MTTAKRSHQHADTPTASGSSTNNSNRRWHHCAPYRRRRRRAFDANTTFARITTTLRTQRKTHHLSVNWPPGGGVGTRCAGPVNIISTGPNQHQRRRRPKWRWDDHFISGHRFSLQSMEHLDHQPGPRAHLHCARARACGGSTGQSSTPIIIVIIIASTINNKSIIGSTSRQSSTSPRRYKSAALITRINQSLNQSPIR